VFCTVSCTRAAPDVRATEPDVGPLPSFAAASPPVPASSSGAPSASTLAIATPAADAGDACRKLALDLGGTVERQTFEGRVVIATGHDPEQGDGAFPVLVADTPVCGAYDVGPQQELLLGVLGGKAKWEAFGATWKGQRVRVTGDVRSMDVYLRPLRHFLVFVSHVEPLP